MLKSAVAAAISAIVYNNHTNQSIALKNGIIRPLGLLLKSRNMTVQLKVSAALEALAVNNQATQEAILEYDAANYMIRLMEVNLRIFLSCIFNKILRYFRNKKFKRKHLINKTDRITNHQLQPTSLLGQKAPKV